MKLDTAPTKSNLLTLRRQLAVAEEGYDLLEQKRQILVAELMSRLTIVREAQSQTADALRSAFAALGDAQLDSGSEAIEKASLAVHMEHEVLLSEQHLMGMKIPQVTVHAEPLSPQFGPTGTSLNTDMAMALFVEALPFIGALAEVENVVMQLALELRKTQRRCNALSKIFIPAYRETISYIASTLEERERESFVILKMIRDRLRRQSPAG